MSSFSARFLRSTLGRLKEKYEWQDWTIVISPVCNNFTKNLLIRRTMKTETCSRDESTVNSVESNIFSSILLKSGIASTNRIIERATSGVTRGRGDTLHGGDTRRKKTWANLQRILDKLCGTGKKGAGWHPPGGWHPSEINKSDSGEQKKSSVFQGKINRRDTAELADGDGQFFSEKN